MIFSAHFLRQYRDTPHGVAAHVTEAQTDMQENLTTA
jgi:hypothetical protein